jgi:hypothetical protein
MNITENSDERANADPFTLVSTGTRYSALKNENDIFITHNDTKGQMYLSLVQVYPTVKNITSKAIHIDCEF